MTYISRITFRIICANEYNSYFHNHTVFNEAKTIEILLTTVRNVQLPYKKEIIVIDDCSTGESSEVLTSAIPYYTLSTEMHCTMFCYVRSCDEGHMKHPI